jgi:hypothetical protein
MVLLEANFNLNTRSELKSRNASLPTRTSQINDSQHSCCNSTQVSDFTPLTSDLTIFAENDFDEDFEYSYSESENDDNENIDCKPSHKDEGQIYEPESGTCLRVYFIFHL